MSSDDLFAASRAGNLEEVERILSIPDGKAPDPDDRDKLGRTAMHLAAWAGFASVVKCALCPLEFQACMLGCSLFFVLECSL